MDGMSLKLTISFFNGHKEKNAKINSHIIKISNWCTVTNF